MYKFFGLILISAIAIVAVGGKRININGAFSHFAEKMNNRHRCEGTTRPLPEVQMGPRVKYSEATFVGVDSLKRTGDCWQDLNGTDLIFDINYGFQLMAVVLPQLEVGGKNMSAFIRIRQNSIHLTYTLHNDSVKCLTLNVLRIERMENVEFGASRPDFDGSNLEGLFKLVVVPTLNGVIQSNITNIEDFLQGLCKVKDFRKKDSVQELVMSLL